MVEKEVLLMQLRVNKNILFTIGFGDKNSNCQDKRLRKKQFNFSVELLLVASFNERLDKKT